MVRFSIYQWVVLTVLWSTCAYWIHVFGSLSCKDSLPRGLLWFYLNLHCVCSMRCRSCKPVFWEVLRLSLYTMWSYSIFSHFLQVEDMENLCCCFSIDYSLVYWQCHFYLHCESLWNGWERGRDTVYVVASSDTWRKEFTTRPQSDFVWRCWSFWWAFLQMWNTCIMVHWSM
jgi:hypothetical protein